MLQTENYCNIECNLNFSFCCYIFLATVKMKQQLKVVTKYMYQTKDNGIVKTFKRNISKRNIDEKISDFEVMFYR